MFIIFYSTDFEIFLKNASLMDKFERNYYNTFGIMPSSETNSGDSHELNS